MNHSFDVATLSRSFFFTDDIADLFVACNFVTVLAAYVFVQVATIWESSRVFVQVAAIWGCSGRFFVQVATIWGCSCVCVQVAAIWGTSRFFVQVAAIWSCFFVSEVVCGLWSVGIVSARWIEPLVLTILEKLFKYSHEPNIGPIEYLNGSKLSDSQMV